MNHRAETSSARDEHARPSLVGQVLEHEGDQRCSRGEVILQELRGELALVHLAAYVQLARNASTAIILLPALGLFRMFLGRIVCKR
jgi:hypothetical protein